MTFGDAAYELGRSALIQSFHRVSPNVSLDQNGYVSSPSENLIDGVHLIDFEADLRQGAGKELEGNFLAAYSSSALVVNTFAPFKKCKATAPLPRGEGFQILAFERKCPHGLRRGTPPHLDVLAKSPCGVVGIESKCLEFLAPHTTKFAPAYDAEILDSRRASVWFEEMQRLVESPERYRRLNAAQLVKHAFGLAYSFPDEPTTLLYLYWEPSNPNSYPIFAEHRAEITRFVDSMAGGTPSFVAMSYPELWKLWDGLDEPYWLANHIHRLRSRYELEL